MQASELDEANTEGFGTSEVDNLGHAFNCPVEYTAPFSLMREGWGSENIESTSASTLTSIFGSVVVPKHFGEQPETPLLDTHNGNLSVNSPDLTLPSVIPVTDLTSGSVGQLEALTADGYNRPMVSLNCTHLELQHHPNQ